jgi:hypothetical protein
MGKKASGLNAGNKFNKKKKYKQKTIQMVC